ncbi:MAG TPA: hypothetical protein DD979_12115 [Gammaproteobacteria bacterium]|nr:hypothetical protein [Gammaproteobacteria bacterium]
MLAALYATTPFAEEEADYLGLAALMIKDGQYLRAGESLEKVDTSVKKFDWQRYHTLRGLVYQEQELHQQTIDAFTAAQAAGQEDPIINVYLAKAWFALDELENAKAALDNTGELQQTLPAIWNLRIGIALKDEDYPSAWTVLDQTIALFPQEKAFQRQRFFLAMQLQLFKEAAALGRAYLQQDNVDKADYIAIANALTRSGEAEAALEFLEQARALFPDKHEVYLALGHAYLALDQVHTAAAMLEAGARIKPAMYKDAAELYRRANNIERALYLNARVSDQAEKLKQRLAIFLEGLHYEQIVAMHDELLRVKLMDDENIRYALAYSHYKTGDFEEAETLLQTLTNPSLFRKSAELRKSMASCNDLRWLCL